MSSELIPAKRQKPYTK